MLFDILADTQPPIAKSCPGDVDIFEGETPSWSAPEFEDNVGIATETAPTIEKNLPVGNYIQHHIAYDYDGNFADCKFLVSVHSQGNQRWV